MNEHLLHRLRYSLFVMMREDDLQFFSAVRYISGEQELRIARDDSIGSLQAAQAGIRDDSAELVQVSSVLARRCFLFRDQHKLALGDQQCACGREFSLAVQPKTSSARN
jgi:hypothetical protein